MLPLSPRTPIALLLCLLTLPAPTAAQNIDLGNLFGGVNKMLQGINSSRQSPLEEQRIGDQAAATLLGTAPLHPNQDLQRYVSDIGLWIARQSEQPDLNWRFGVLHTSSVNAFAAPGGYVFVTSGLLARLGNEAELAGVLAHEIAHVLKRHHMAALQKKNLTEGGAALFGEIAQAKGKNEVKMSLNVASGVYSSGLDKADEHAADRIGMVLATRSGYDPYGLPRVLQMYAAGAGSAGFELLFATHPTPEERLDHLDEKIGARLDSYEPDSVKNTPRFAKVMASALGRR